MRLLAAFLLGCLTFAQEPDAAALAERLQREAVAFAEGQRAEGGYRIRALKAPVLPRIAGDEVRFEPSHLSKREPVGPFFAVFKVLVNGRLAGNARVDLEGRWSGTLLRAKELLRRKTVPTDDQFEAFAFEGVPPTGALASLPQGFRLRLQAPVGHVLTQGDLEPIPLVATGERVRVTVQSGPLAISAEATARANGALGDKVRVELPSRKWLQAIVTGPGEARVDWTI